MHSVDFAAPPGPSSSPSKHISLVSPLQSSLLCNKISLCRSLFFLFFEKEKEKISHVGVFVHEIDDKVSFFDICFSTDGFSLLIENG